MNEAHLHMVVNHFPIIGTIFGLGVLMAGMITKKLPLKIRLMLYLLSQPFLPHLAWEPVKGQKNW